MNIKGMILKLALGLVVLSPALAVVACNKPAGEGNSPPRESDPEKNREAGPAKEGTVKE